MHYFIIHLMVEEKMNWIKSIKWCTLSPNQIVYNLLVIFLFGLFYCERLFSPNLGRKKINAKNNTSSSLLLVGESVSLNVVNTCKIFSWIKVNTARGVNRAWIKLIWVENSKWRSFFFFLNQGLWLFFKVKGKEKVFFFLSLRLLIDDNWW